MKKIHLVKDNSLWFYKRHEPLVKETSNPDRGRNKEIGTFLFIIIKTHSVLYTDALDFLLKGKTVCFTHLTCQTSLD